MVRVLCSLWLLVAVVSRSCSQEDDCVSCFAASDGEICATSPPAANVSQECCGCLGPAASGDDCIERVDSFRNVSECCNIAGSISAATFAAPPSNSGSETCTDQAVFAPHTDDRPSNENISASGEYIVPHYKFTCSGCVKDVRFSVTTGNTTLENDVLKFHIWREYETSVALGIAFVRTSSHSVQLFTEGGSQMRAVPLDQASGSQSCIDFQPGDILGFSATNLSLVALEFTERHITYSVGDLSDCPYIYSLANAMDERNWEPQFTITLEPPATEPPPVQTTDATSPTNTSATTTVLPPSTDPTVIVIVQTTAVPVYAIIVASVGGVITILLLAVVVMVIVMVVKFHSTRKTADLTGRRQSFFESFRRRPRRSVSTVMSPRMEVLVNARHQPPTNAETVENHEYDAPIELLGHNYHVLETPATGIYATDGYKYTTMYTPSETNGGQSMAVNLDDDEAYHDPTELGSQHEITAKRHTVKNPLYSTSAGASEEMEAFQNQQEMHYDEPYELMKGQLNAQGVPFYHVLEESAPVGAGNRVYRSRSSSMAISLSSDNSEEGRHSNGESVEPSSVTSEGAVIIGSPLTHHYHLLEESTRSQSLSSLSSHHVFDSGVYVPNAEEREQLAGEEGGDISAQIYTTWTLGKRQDSSKKKQFFQSSDKYWEPALAEQQLYDQFHARKFREILRDQIEFKEHLGVGQFGSVCLATLSSQGGAGSKRVAVKTMKPSAQKDAKVKFLQEAAIMGQFFHSNVIKLHGVVTVGEPVMVVMELMALGDLANYLSKNYRPGVFDPPHPKTLLSFSRQVACGMKYLSKKSFVHRDLAARNVLVSETLVCKIGDFGMSRDLKESEYYISSGGTVPIKWTAPEALNYKRYSTASDVYSYGMVLYEIWSLARKPLSDVAIPNVARMVSEGYCQPPPPGCPRRMYDIMVQCWNPAHEERVTFTQLFEILNTSDDSSLLGWSKEDREVSPQTSKLGGPLSASWDLYLDLQLTHRRNKQEDS